MKPYYLLLSVFALLLLSSCERYFFVNPQPVDQPNEKVFPKELRGLWLSSEGDTFKVEKGAYQLCGTMEVKLCISCQDSMRSYRILGNKIYILDKTEQPPVIIGTVIKQTNDSVYAAIQFNERHLLGEDVILRKVGGGLILNLKAPNNSAWWTPYLVQASGDTTVIYLLNQDLKERLADELIFEFNDADECNSNYEGVYTNKDWRLDELNAELEDLYKDTLYTLYRIHP